MAFPSLFIANLRIIFRNRQAIFWALAFPLLFVVVFGFFIGNGVPTTTIAVVDHAQDQLSQNLMTGLAGVETLELEIRADEAEARQEVTDGDLGFLLILPAGLEERVASDPPAIVTLLFDEGSPTSGLIVGVVRRFLDDANLTLAGAPTLLVLDASGIYSDDVDYFDFLLPGILGMGIMVYSIVGLASSITVFREQRILKRIQATPLRITTFFTAQVLAYLTLALLQAAVILGVGVLAYDANIKGSYLGIGIIVLFGNLVFLSLGFIVGAFSKTAAAASGMGNAVALPMMFLSGAFFPRDGLPTALRVVVDYLPLSPMLDALRGVALDGRALWEFPLELAILSAWIVVASAVAVRIFRFS
ncbi:MAG: ABC-2 type transport system permease protein [Chloroflexi bacterium]|jgi:ABC-2 type transport system permease protein|nr:MAG: ABC-2 type transport system permease protein [Chloroflexota bacterium]